MIAKANFTEKKSTSTNIAFMGFSQKKELLRSPMNSHPPTVSQIFKY